MGWIARTRNDGFTVPSAGASCLTMKTARPIDVYDLLMSGGRTTVIFGRVPSRATRRSLASSLNVGGHPNGRGESHQTWFLLVIKDLIANGHGHIHRTFCPVVQHV
jgi:hypothetical protein